MATPIVIWGSLMEMRYSPAQTAGGVLCKGRIGRYLFEIVDCYGNHPCVYVHLPKNYPLDKVLEPWWEEIINDEFVSAPPLYEGISLPVHGGLTYSGMSKSRRHGVVLGWDYGHLGDWCGHLDGVRPNFFGGERYPKKWTVAELLTEIQDAVQWLESRRLKRA